MYFIDFIITTLLRTQADSGAHSTSSTIGNEDSFWRVKRPGHDGNHSPPSSVKFKNAWSSTSPPPYTGVSEGTATNSSGDAVILLITDVFGCGLDE